MSKLVKTSKVTKIEPNGSFPGQRGEIFKFNIEFENGDKGEFTTNKNPQVKFVEGETVKYTVEEITINTKNGPWKKIKIDKLKEEGGRQYSDDPSIQYRIIRTVALKAAISSLIFEFEGSMNDTANVYIDWIVEKGLDADSAIPAQSAIAEAVRFHEVTQKKPENIENILGLADIFYKFILKKKENKDE